MQNKKHEKKAGQECGQRLSEIKTTQIEESSVHEKPKAKKTSGDWRVRDVMY